MKMDSVHYSLSSKEYKSNIFTGFSQLQKQEEFVDLILAADGHLVKVHKNLIALASPYLKEILKSMSNCPVIFLNNVSHDVLTYLLVYIYQGEVNIPIDSIDAFIEVSKSLHITGIEDLEWPKEKVQSKLIENRRKILKRRASVITAHSSISSDTLSKDGDPQTVIENNDTYPFDFGTEQPADVINNARIVIQQEQNNDQHDPELLSHNTQNIPLIEIKTDNRVPETHIGYLLENQKETTHENMPIIEFPAETNPAHDYKIMVKTAESPNNMPVIEIQPSNFNQPLTRTDVLQPFQDNSVQIEPEQCENNQVTPQINRPMIQVLENIVLTPAVCSTNEGTNRISFGEAPVEPTGGVMSLMHSVVQYSITERGCIELILNRFMYCCHHKTRSKRRWRCIDYRRGSCKALIDTVNGVITARKGMHVHPFHDMKIMKKRKKGLIFPTVELAIAAKDLKKKETLKTLSIDETDEDY